MTEAKYEALVLEGPRDGQQVTCTFPTFKAVINREVPVQVGPDENPRTATRTSDFEYQYFEAPWGGRYWIPREIVTEKTFEGKAYTTPFEFIMATLEAGYSK